MSHVAGRREAGAECPQCRRSVLQGDACVECARCGAVHHEHCWQTGGGCGTFECAPPRRSIGQHETPSIRVTAGDIDGAVPLPRPRPAAPGFAPPPPPPAKSRTSRLAVVAFILSVLGIFFVAVTGLVGIVLGSVALGSIQQTRQRGTVLAVASVLLGVLDIVGWVIFVSFMFSGHGPHLTVADFEPDMSVLENLPKHINRAMRANVVVEVRSGWGALGQSAMGSGVILKIDDGSALIVTNRHVVDSGFADGSAAEPAKPAFLGVKLLGQPAQPGRVVWVAPDGVDLALVTTPVYTDEARAVVWQDHPKIAVGDEVFSIGNPQGLEWSHAKGTISQVRSQHHGARKISIIQTDTAINPGNSGGGLYDAQGRLLGINTWTNDKRFSEGLSFAIAFQSLLDLDPPNLKSSPRGRKEDRGPGEKGEKEP